MALPSAVAIEPRSSTSVAALIAAERPDVVLVELDAERLQLLWGGDRNVYGGELYEAVRAARAADAPVARR